MTFSHNKTTRVAEMTTRCSPSQPDVIFRRHGCPCECPSSFFIATRMVTAISPTIAIQNAHALDLSCSNLLVVANQNTHAFGPNSILARWKKKTKPRSLVVAMTKMMVAIRQNFIHHCFCESSASWPPRSCPPLVFSFVDDLAR